MWYLFQEKFLGRLTDTRPWPLNEDWRSLVNLESLYGTWVALPSVNFDITCENYIISNYRNEVSVQMHIHPPIKITTKTMTATTTATTRQSNAKDSRHCLKLTNPSFLHQSGQRFRTVLSIPHKNNVPGLTVPRVRRLLFI